MSAAPHPTMTARRVAEAAYHLCNLADKAETQAARVIALHRAGNCPAAEAARGLRDEHDRLMLVAHQRANVTFGAGQVRRALTVERRRRAAAHQAEVA